MNGHIKFKVNTDEFKGIKHKEYKNTSVNNKASKKTYGTATYAEIQEYVLNTFGLNVSTLYIAQTKEKCGIKERKNYNKGSEGHKAPHCTKEKEEAIIKAFKHFKMI